MKTWYVAAGMVAESGSAGVLMTETLASFGRGQSSLYRGFVLIDRYSGSGLEILQL